MVASDMANNTRQIEVSNNLCHSGNQIPVSGNQLVINPHINNLSNVFGVSPEKTTTDDHSVLLFDVNNMCDRDKFLNTVCPKSVRALIEGNKAFDCSVFM